MKDLAFQVLYDLDDNGNYKLSKRNTRKVKTTYEIEEDDQRTTVDEQIQIDKRAITWALKQPKLTDDSFQILETLSNGDLNVYKRKVCEYINEFIPKEWSLLIENELDSMERKNY